MFKWENVLYTLIGDDKIYSNKDFPIKNVNPSMIYRVLEDSTKFLGKAIPRVTLTKCDPIPKSEVRKQYGNQKLPIEEQPIAPKSKQ
ncbi:hypothetical protein Hanom_Chr03g00231641 [Helianthus anomalus]